MGEVVNLNRARKAKARAAAEKTAANNRVKHGTPKHLRKKGDAERNRTEAELEGKRLDDETNE
jgi:hypothetical protein